MGFDASNRVCPDERYIRIGSGVDAIDAAPIGRGSQNVTAPPDRDGDGWRRDRRH